jgi:hypothetical protein
VLAGRNTYEEHAGGMWGILTEYTTINSPQDTLQTEFSFFCKMKYLLEEETHNKNEENTLKELNKIFLMVYGLPK